MTDIASRISAIRQEIGQVCVDCGRDPGAVHLLAVSKTMGLDAVTEAIKAGQREFGENYLQDALPKVTAFPDVSWHFIGAIQSNKTREIASRFAWVHSLASAKVARRLQDQRDPTLPALNCLIQVNLSGEAQKSGLAPDEASNLVGELRSLDRVRLKGLMVIPAPSASPAAQAAPFKLLRELRDDIRNRWDLPHFDQLSMGMTDDFHEAIREGATWIRIGTAIFGPRSSIIAP